MKIILPISRGDSPRLPLLVDVMLHHGNLQGHAILLVPTASVRDVAEVAAERLRAACPQVDVAAMDTDPPYGWFTAPNMQFHFAVFTLHQQGYRGAWFWNEVDCVPVKPTWANDLQAEWVAHNKPFCGCVVETPFRDAAGNVTTVSGDTMMMGCGIYPSGMATDELIRPLYNDLCKTPPYAADQPWDVYLRWVCKNRGVAHTPLIGDMWNTHNYRVEADGSLACDPAPTKFVGRSRGGVVDARAVVVHGCKDESLYRIVLGALDYALPAPAAPVEAAEMVTATNQIEPQSAPPPADAAPPILIINRMIRDGKKPKLGEVAKLAGISSDELRAMLPSIGYEAKAFGWLAKKEAA